MDGNYGNNSCATTIYSLLCRLAFSTCSSKYSILSSFLLCVLHTPILGDSSQKISCILNSFWYQVIIVKTLTHTNHAYTPQICLRSDKNTVTLRRLCSQKSKIYQYFIFSNTTLSKRRWYAHVWWHVSSRMPDISWYNPDKLWVCWSWKEKVMFLLVLHPIVDSDQEEMGTYS